MSIYVWMHSTKLKLSGVLDSLALGISDRTLYSATQFSMIGPIAAIESAAAAAFQHRQMTDGRTRRRDNLRVILTSQHKPGLIAYALEALPYGTLFKSSFKYYLVSKTGPYIISFLFRFVILAASLQIV